jgi:hypothetical protein
MLNLLGKAWKRWLKIAEVIGNIQMTIFLTLMYWTVLFLIAVPFKIFSDPLSLRNFGHARWTPLDPKTDVLESMRRQG